jgi:hypothetical protein
LHPLQWLQKNPPAQGRARQIFLLTDGEISNVDEVLDLCRAMVTSSRIFSFGLGQSPSRSLVKGLARATNGRFVFIPPNTSVDVHVGEQLQKALQPCITNVQVKWNLGATLSMSVPTKIPPVYVNDRLIVYALLEDKSTPFDHNSNVELKTEQHRLGEAKVTRLPSVTDNEMIARLAAKALIFELQHSKLPPSTNKNVTGSLQSRFVQTDQQTTVSNNTDEVNKETIKKRIVDLSLKYNILSPHTAFVGVEKRTNANNDNMVLREVPIQISADDQHLQIQSQWCSSGSLNSMSKCMVMPSYSTMCALASDGEDSDDSDFFAAPTTCASFNSHLANDVWGDLDMCPPPLCSVKMKIAAEVVWPTNEQDTVRHLISKQKFDGSWDLDSIGIEKLTGKSLTDFKNITNDQVLVSAIVIAVLETRFASFSTMWHGVVQKARKRLIDLLGKDVKKLDSLLEDIRRQL